MMGAVLFKLKILLVGFLMGTLVAGPSLADQTDTRLDELFLELKTGGAINAEDNVNRILEIWSDSQSDTIDLLYTRALGLFHEGKHKEAGLLLTYTRSLSPNFMQAYALSGFLKLTIDDRAGALSDFSRALELEPRQFEVRKALADMLLSAGEKREAYDMIQRSLEWNPHDESMLRLARKLRLELQGQDI